MCSGHPHAHAEPWPGLPWISTGTTHPTALGRFTLALKCSQVKADCSLLCPQEKAGTLSRVPQQLLSPRLTTGQSCTPSMATSMAHCLVSPGGTGTGVGGMGAARSRGGARSVKSRQLVKGCEKRDPEEFPGDGSVRLCSPLRDYYISAP